MKNNTMLMKVVPMVLTPVTIRIFFWATSSDVFIIDTVNEIILGIENFQVTVTLVHFNLVFMLMALATTIKRVNLAVIYCLASYLLISMTGIDGWIVELLADVASVSLNERTFYLVFMMISQASMIEKHGMSSPSKGVFEGIKGMFSKG